VGHRCWGGWSGRQQGGHPINSLVAVVTGGARGIGAAVAAALAEAGASVAVGDLDADEARASVAAYGGLGAALDVTDTASYASFLSTVEDQLGAVDVLVNNAGVMWVGSYHDEPESVAHKQFEVNLHGVIRGIKLVVPGMVGRGRGHVVTIASAASRIAPAGEATYAATKHAVYGYCNALRGELRGTGVHISVVMPSVVETELARGTAHGSVPRLRPSDVAAAVVKAVRRPRFEVYVPRRLAVLDRALGVLPGRARLAAHDALVPDQRRKTDQAARADYQRERFH